MQNWLKRSMLAASSLPLNMCNGKEISKIGVRRGPGGVERENKLGVKMAKVDNFKDETQKNH